MRTNKCILGIIFFIAILFVGCSPATEQIVEEQELDDNKQKPLQIYTTIYPLEDFTKKIGGSFVEVQSILPPGVDSHSFEPSTKTMIAIAEADAFFFNSHQMERYATKISDSVKAENVKVIEAGKGVEMIKHQHEHGEKATATKDSQNHENEAAVSASPEHDHDEAAIPANAEHDHGDVDPHVWIDPMLALEVAENIKNALVELKPEAKDEFEKNFQTLKQQLVQLDNDFHRIVDMKKQKTILVSHAAYGYWEKNYGIKQISVTGLSPTNEPSQKELEKIIKTSKENNIHFVIFEQNITPKVTEIVKNELHAEALFLHNLEVLTEVDIKNNEDYFSLMRKNLNTLDKAMK